jgi:HEPN domain-containing protein
MEKSSTASEGSLYPADWLRIAEKDLRRVSQLLKAHDTELAGFCLQQAAEKFLKAFLLSQGWQLRRIHNLDTLLDDAVARDPSLEEFREVCQRVTAYYFVERYPPIVETGMTKDDVRASLVQVNELAMRLRAKLGTK